MILLEAISSQRLYRRIADQLADKIRHGEFAPGTRLPAERELAERLNVARSTVREALIALELGGYVEVRVGSGVFVLAPQSDGDYGASHSETPAGELVEASPFELLESRLLIEPEVAALAAQNATPEQIEALTRLHAQMTADHSEQASDFAAHRAFHEAIATASGNVALASVVSHLWIMSEASPMMRRLGDHFETKPVWDVAVDEHDRVLAAISAGDPIRARHAMAVHLLGITSRLSEDLDKAGTSQSPSARRRRAARPHPSSRLPR